MRGSVGIDRRRLPRSSNETNAPAMPTPALPAMHDVCPQKGQLAPVIK
jgi:hypothetical protein